MVFLWASVTGEPSGSAYCERVAGAAGDGQHVTQSTRTPTRKRAAVISDSKPG